MLFIIFQVRYKLAPLIWKRLYKDRARFTGGANAITLLLGGRGDSMWPSSLTLIIVTAIVACVHTVMLSKYLISAPIPRSQASDYLASLIRTYLTRLQQRQRYYYMKHDAIYLRRVCIRAWNT